MNPFDYVNSINYNKKYLMIDEESEKAYNSFTINRSLSYFQDTVLMANEMNLNSHIDKKLKYDFLINIVRKRKRFSKWNKPEVDDDLKLVKEYYGYSSEKAYQVLSILSSDQIKMLKEKVNKGGRRK